jgi:hypothetical protein
MKAWADTQAIIHQLKSGSVLPPTEQYLKTVCERALPASWPFEKSVLRDELFLSNDGRLAASNAVRHFWVRARLRSTAIRCAKT